MNIKKLESFNNNNSRAIYKILQQSKKKNTIGEQMKMANYYAYLQTQSQNDNINYAKLLLGL